MCHGWITVDGRKGAKSKGNISTPGELAASLSEKAGIDRSIAIDFVRYYLVSNAPFERDHEYSEHEFYSLYNTDFANEIGNLLYRTVSVLHKKCEGVVYPPYRLPAEVSDARQYIENQYDKAAICFDNLRPDEGLAIIRTLAKWCNKYINDQHPWSAEDEDARNTLFVCVSALAVIARVLKWVCPDVADKIEAQLSLAPGDKWTFGNIPSINWRVHEPSILLPRIDKTLIPAKDEK